MRVTSLVATLLAASTVGAACGGRGSDGDPDPGHLRGGSIAMSRSAVGGFEPAEALSGVGAFFAPPGPALSSWPEHEQCEWMTPVPEETGTPEPTPTPAVDWREAGDALTLRSDAYSLELVRFEGPAGEILYLTRADALPETFPTGAAYDVEIAGSEAPNGVAGTVLPGAVVAPAAVGLYAPDFALAPVPLSREALQIGWTPGEDEEETVRVRIVISGSAGSATLTCGTGDDGFFEVSAPTMEAFPGGGGTLTVSRRGLQATKLAGDTWLDTETVLTEGGAVVLP